MSAPIVSGQDAALVALAFGLALLALQIIQLIPKWFRAWCARRAAARLRIRFSDPRKVVDAHDAHWRSQALRSRFDPPTEI